MSKASAHLLTIQVRTCRAPCRSSWLTWLTGRARGFKSLALSLSVSVSVYFSRSLSLSFPLSLSFFLAFFLSFLSFVLSSLAFAAPDGSLHCVLLRGVQENCSTARSCGSKGAGLVTGCISSSGLLRCHANCRCKAARQSLEYLLVLTHSSFSTAHSQVSLVFHQVQGWSRCTTTLIGRMHHYRPTALQSSPVALLVLVAPHVCAL